MRIGARQPRKKLRFFLALVVLVVVAAGGWLVLRVGPVPEVVVTTDYPAVGRATTITALFSEPVNGLASIRLELIQGDRAHVLDTADFVPGSPLPWSADDGTAEAALSAVVGTDTIDWLADGEVVVRAIADIDSGLLRRADPVVVDKVLPVRLKPPRLELISPRTYARQGGAGAVVYKVGETAVRSGVRAGDHRCLGSPREDGGVGERFVLFAVPWDLDDAGAIRLFAEDDAGHLVERPLLDHFSPHPPKIDTIRVTDGFLERVVPAIAQRTPGFDDSGTLLEQYLEINRDLRRAELERLAQLSRLSEPAFLWSGPFLQMANSARMAGFAEQRTYVYDGREVDQQTHLGLDLASTAHAPVPAPNTGRVLFAGWMTLYGNAVVIDHGYGLLSVCGHLSTVDVVEGEMVERGRIIGSSGATGLAGGDHLHLEILVHGVSVDPIQWLDGHWIENNITSKLTGG